MICANRPWKLVLGLLSALTASVATVALANLNNTVWRAAGTLDIARLVILTVVSLATVVVWLVVVHKLWRRPSEHMTERQARLFNATMLVTLLSGVGTLYRGLFAFKVITGALVID
jgi:FlaA1/EpsC-like NDP-sugar epimerase